MTIGFVNSTKNVDRAKAKSFSRCFRSHLLLHSRLHAQGHIYVRFFIGIRSSGIAFVFAFD